jgi:hypothetical protein
MVTAYFYPKKHGNYGRKHTEEEKKKMSLAHLGKRNPMRGKHQSPETIENIRLAKLGDKNPMWKGNDIAYGAIHYRIKKILPKPELCQSCVKNLAHDLANKSGKYLLDISDWWWLCRTCHMESDGRMKNLRNHQCVSETW